VIDVRIIGHIRCLGALELSISSTALIYVLIPVAVVAVIVGLALAGGDSRRRSRRYRPGRPFEFRPVWFLASPGQVVPAPGGRTADRRAQPPAIESGIVEDPSGATVRPGPTGGASDRW
jgi:hypothetical protein